MSQTNYPVMRGNEDFFIEPRPRTNFRFRYWSEVQDFLEQNETARVIASPYPGSSYNDFIVFVPHTRN
jgi:hypothetical protein